MNTLPLLPDDDTLLSLAGPAAFKRGTGYAQEGRVHIDTVTDKSISGQAQGTHQYTVSLAVNENEEDFYGECNCPAAMNGDFCKHLVALVLVARSSDEPAQPPGSNLSAFLRSQSVDVLADKLLAFAVRHPDINKDLAFWFRSSQAGDSGDLSKVIGTLLRSNGFIDYRRSFDYAERIKQVTALLRSLVTNKPALCMESAEYALLRLLKILERCDDSAGAISFAMEDLANIHLQALKLSSPVKKFGQRFLKLMLTDQWQFFPQHLYQPAMGSEAWNEYGRGLESAYAKLPPHTLRKRHEFTSAEDLDRNHLIRLLEAWYASNNDIEAMFALKIRELDQAWDYAKLIEQFSEHGRHRDALAWAEKGLKLFPEDSRMYGLLSECYLQDGCTEDAHRILWQWFEKWPTAHHYLKLMQHASMRAAEWHDRAFAYLEALEESELNQRLKRDHQAIRDVSVRLEILLQEKALDEAVKISRNAVANGNLVLALADMAYRKFPEISVPVYRRQIDIAVSRGNNAAYEQAIVYVRKLLPLFAKNERTAYLLELRTRFKAKRNFIKLLESF